MNYGNLVPNNNEFSSKMIIKWGPIVFYRLNVDGLVRKNAEDPVKDENDLNIHITQLGFKIRRCIHSVCYSSFIIIIVIMM